MTGKSTPASQSRRVSKRRTEAVERAINVFDTSVDTSRLTRPDRQRFRSRIAAAARPLVVAKQLVRRAKVLAGRDAARRSEPLVQPRDFSAATEAVARANREIATHWPWLTAGAVEVEREAVALMKRLASGNLRQQRFDELCTKLSNPAWFSKTRDCRAQ